MSHKLCSLVVAAVGAVLVAPSARGAIIVATDTQNGASPFTPTYTPSSTDLINGLAPTAQAGNFGLEGAGGVPVLTNGVYGTIDRSGAYAAPFATAGSGAGTSLTYTLPSASNLTSVVVYGGWQDNGRDQQGYTLLTSTDGVNFTPVTTVNYNPPLATGGVPSATRVTISSDAGPLASSVTAIRFDFTTVAVENGYTGYAEIDVFGSAVPEPASLGLLGLGGLGLLARRRSR